MPYGVLQRERYPELDLGGISSNEFSSGDSHLQFNGIGLAFRARHLVTLDFPTKTLYLKRVVQQGSPTLEFKQAQAGKASRSVMRLLGRLKSEGRLPGWQKNDSWGNRREQLKFQFPDVVICENVRKKGDPSRYQYEFRRLPDLNWQLAKAWRLAENIERFDLYSAE